jgi:hypothetical protein
VPTAGSYGVGSRGGSGSGYVPSYLLPHEDYTTISTDPIPIGSQPVTAARSASYASNLLRTVSDCASAFDNFPSVNLTSTLSLEKFFYVINFPEIFYNCLRIIVQNIWHKKISCEPLQLACCFYQDHFGFCGPQVTSSGVLLVGSLGVSSTFRRSTLGSFMGVTSTMQSSRSLLHVPILSFLNSHWKFT